MEDSTWLGDTIWPVTQGLLLPNMPWDWEDPSYWGAPIRDRERPRGQRVMETLANWNVEYISSHLGNWRERGS
jgi:hypothetical protein